MDIAEIANIHKFSDARVIPADSFAEWEKHYNSMKAYGEPSTHAMTADPKNIMPDTKCIIVFLKAFKPYYGWPGENVIINPHYLKYNEAYFETQKIMDIIKKAGYSADASSQIPKRHAAFRAGYGRSGVFGPLIHPEYGSYINFSTIITNMPLDITHNVTGGIQSCNNCGKCSGACPGGAIIGGGSVVRNKCLRDYFPCSGPVPNWAKEKAGRMFIGCDICQSSCPINAKIKPELPPQELISCTKIIDLLQFDKPIFKEKLHELQSLVGVNEAKPLKTAATTAIIAGNTRNPEYIPALLHMLKNHDSKYVRMNAAWALGRIGGCQDELKSCLGAEIDGDVAIEIRSAVEAL